MSAFDVSMAAEPTECDVIGRDGVNHGKNERRWRKYVRNEGVVHELTHRHTRQTVSQHTHTHPV